MGMFAGKNTKKEPLKPDSLSEEQYQQLVDLARRKAREEGSDIKTGVKVSIGDNVFFVLSNPGLAGSKMKLTVDQNTMEVIKVEIYGRKSRQ